MNLFSLNKYNSYDNRYIFVSSAPLSVSAAEDSERATFVSLFLSLSPQVTNTLPLCHFDSVSASRCRAGSDAVSSVLFFEFACCVFNVPIVFFRSVFLSRSVFVILDSLGLCNRFFWLH